MITTATQTVYKSGTATLVTYDHHKQRVMIHANYEWLDAAALLRVMEAASLAFEALGADIGSEQAEARKLAESAATIDNAQLLDVMDR